MKLLIVLCAVVAVSVAGYLPGAYLSGAYLGYPAPLAVLGDDDSPIVAQQNALAEAQGVAAAAQGAGYLPGAYLSGAYLGYPAPLAVLGDDDSPIVAQQNALAEAQGVAAAAQGATAAAEGAALSSGAPGALAAPIILSPLGVPVDTPEVQSARAANALAHLQAKAALFG